MTPAEIIALFGPPEEGGLAKVVGGERVERAMDDLCAYYTRHHDRLASLHEGIDDVLRYLSDRGVTLAIFTGKGRRTAMITLEALHIDKYFDMIVSGSDVERHKPHHEGIVKVIESYGLDPAEVMMVGDAVSDVMASRAAGVKVAAVLWDAYDKEGVLKAEADYVFNSVDEMLEWFRNHIN